MGKNIINLIILAIYKLVCKNSQIFYVSGMRRSGNHAFIQWFTNALLNANANLEYGTDKIGWFTGKISTGELFHLNEMNTMGIKFQLICLYRNYKLLRKCRYVIFSFEDTVPDDLVYRLTNARNHIFVRRNTLSLVASRIQGMIRDARKGRANLGFEVNEQKLTTIKDWRAKCAIQWHYDEWLVNTQYRQEFLDKFGLTYDSVPNLSVQGGGSSFGESVNELNTLKRYESFDWDKYLVSVLSNERHSSILTTDEINFLKLLG